jgi:hypothetical protein
MHLASPTKRDSLEGRLVTYFASSVSVSLIQCEQKDKSLIISIDNQICFMEMWSEILLFTNKYKIFL